MHVSVLGWVHSWCIRGWFGDVVGGGGYKCSVILSGLWGSWEWEDPGPGHWKDPGNYYANIIITCSSHKSLAAV